MTIILERLGWRRLVHEHRNGLSDLELFRFAFVLKDQKLIADRLNYDPANVCAGGKGLVIDDGNGARFAR